MNVPVHDPNGPSVIDSMRSCLHWYDAQSETLSRGLRSTSDALKLWRWWTIPMKGLPPYADGESTDDTSMTATKKESKTAQHWRIKVLGYDPMERV